MKVYGHCSAEEPLVNESPSLFYDYFKKYQKKTHFSFTDIDINPSPRNTHFSGHIFVWL